MAYQFAYSGPVSYGWEKMKKHFWLFFCVLVLMLVIQQIPNSIGGILRQDKDQGLKLMGSILSLIASLMGILLNLGVIRISLNIFDRDHAEVKDLFACISLFWRALGGAILYGLIVMAGLLLLVIPGIIWAIKYQFFYFFIVDQNCSIGEAFGRSAVITKGYKFNLFIFGILLSLINLLGILCLFVGVFVSIPVTWMAIACVYRGLMENQLMQVQPVTSQQANVGERLP